MKTMALLFVLWALTFCLPAEDVIREEVQVKWFAVPLVATDEQGKCVSDLKPEEIEVFLEGRKVDSFRLVRLGYEVEKEQAMQAPATPAATLVTFLVFDGILTDMNRLNRAKAMAIEIVKRAEGRQPFVVMSLEHVGGLKYLCGPSRQTGEVIEAIEKKVRANRSRFSFQANARDNIAMPIHNPLQGGSWPDAGQELARREKKWMLERYRTTVVNYLEAIKYLCLALQTIRHKSVFLFSIGIKNGFFELSTFGEDPDEGIIGLQLIVRDLAERINRSGTFLVVLNPDGPDPSSDNPDSGDLVSHQLARESGGKYLGAMKENMTESVVEMMRAFYEVQFADPGGGEERMLSVDIRGKRPGVVIHSLRRTSRGREYGELTRLEKEVLALDASVSSYWSRSILEIRRDGLPQPGMSGQQVVYDLALPPQFRQEKVDIFFVQVDEKRNDAKVSSQSLIAESDRHSYGVKPLKGYKPTMFIVCGRLRQGILLQ